jgi:hypothetical protein
MSGLGASMGKVRYDLRPSKQVERMMLIDAFQCLAVAGFSIADYRYVGMGSIQFYDFAIFHKFLAIRRMLSVEINELAERRIRFNKPFGFVDIHIGAIGDVIPTLSRDERHILWLDYDGTISSTLIADTQQAAADLSVGSILLVTVDVEPPARVTKPAEIRKLYQSDLGDTLPADLPISAFREAHLHKANAILIDRAIRRGLMGRRNVQFVGLFNFVYKDGHRMLTVGGMIAGDDERRKVAASLLSERSYCRETIVGDPFRIDVPILTRREKMYLDQHMPASPEWRPADFDLHEDELRGYRDIYRFNPLYGELLI